LCPRPRDRGCSLGARAARAPRAARAMLPQVGGGAPRNAENEARIESCFRRLLASIESEREKIRQTWVSIDSGMKTTGAELEKLRQDTEEWCFSERHKVETEWKRLDRLREKMTVLYPNEKGQELEINCSGRIFSLPKSSLCYIEGSYLNHMFSDAFRHNIPRDSKGRFFLDFNPGCFALIVEYLHKAQNYADASGPTEPPVVPPELQQSMDILAEALNLTIFLRPNCVQKVHSTSLEVKHNSIESTHHGWQIIAAQDPLPLSGAAYFEVKVASNPDSSRGGLAVGLCGHKPTEKEIFTIGISDAIWYVSNNGLVSGRIDDKNVVAMENLQKRVQFKSGAVVGVKHDISNRSIQFFVNRVSIGVCTLNPEVLENFRVLYPIFALYVHGQKLAVDFAAICPSAAKGAAITGERRPAD